MKIAFHGAAKEVGRSCIEIKTEGDRFLLDAGIKFMENGFSYPENLVNVPDVDGLLLSHAHLDHSGALPLLEHLNIICPVFCTKLTYQITKILLKDSYKIERIRNLHPAYEKTDLKKVEKSVRLVKYDQEYKHRGIKFKYLNAGHVPGSAMILIESEGKRVLYTGDLKTRETELMKGVNINALKDKGIDLLITESTYGNRPIPDRNEVRKRFLDKIEETVKKGGSVLIPVFSFGRAQDVIIMLAERKFKVPIYLDGMCKKITNKILTIPDPYVNNRNVLNTMMEKTVITISSENRRKQALSSQGIFVTTSGMIQGGPVMDYIKDMWHDPLNAILLTGFQCKRTNGRHLVEDGFLYIDGWKTIVKCYVEKFEFSGHAGQDDLVEFITAVNPKKVALQHGDVEAVEGLRELLKGKGSFQVLVPGIGDEIEI